MKEFDYESFHNRLSLTFDLKKVIQGASLSKTWRKSENEYVSNLDELIDQKLSSFLSHVLDVPVFSEERPFPAELPTAYWLVDPLDGTHNQIMSLSPTAISIALMVDGLPAVALVCQIQDGHIVSTFRGAHLVNYVEKSVPEFDSQPLVGLSTGILEKSLDGGAWGKFLDSILSLGRVRIFGSQALQGAWVSEGKLQMSFSYESRAWDDCAAGLLVSESGGDWSCFTTKGNLRIDPDMQTSSTFVSKGFKSHSVEAVDLFKKAIGTRDNFDYRLIEKAV